MQDGSGAETQKDPEFLSTLERGLAVLNVFSAAKPQMALSDVAAASRLNPAVARRCLNTLVQLGYVAKQGRMFLLRPKVLEFGDTFLSSANIEQAVVPYLQHLRDETGDSTSMAVRAGDDVMYIAHVSTIRPIRLSAHAGTRFPMHATSLGKVTLAFLPADELDAYLDRSDRQQFTPNTVAKLAPLKKELLRIRRAGFALARDELDYGLCSIAVPILYDGDQVIAAINCSTTTRRADPADFEASRLPLLRETASHIERSLRQFPALVHALKS